MPSVCLSNGDLKLQELGNGDADNGDCMTKATEAASNINALLIAQGKLKPSQLGRGHAAKKVSCDFRFEQYVGYNLLLVGVHWTCILHNCRSP